MSTIQYNLQFNNYIFYIIYICDVSYFIPVAKKFLFYYCLELLLIIFLRIFILNDSYVIQFMTFKF